MKKPLLHTLLAICLLGQMSCYSDQESKEIVIEKVPPKTTIDNNLVVILEGEDGLYSGGVDFDLAGSVQTKSNQSIAYFDSDAVDKYHEILTIIEEDGSKHYSAIRTIENQVNFLHKSIITNHDITRFNPDQSIPSDFNGLNLGLSDKSIMQDGDLYLGEVLVNHKEINASTLKGAESLPYISYGIDDDQTRKLLLIEKAFFLNLQTPDGADLGLDGSTISSEERLYYFDRELGMWRFVTDEPFVSDYIVIAETVSSRSLSGQIKAGDIGLSDQAISIRGGDYLGYSRTTSEGYFEVLAPVGVEVEIDALGCNEIWTIPSSETDQSGLIFPVADWKTISIGGNHQDCQGAVVPVELLLTQSELMFSYLVGQSGQSDQYVVCSNVDQLAAVDVDQEMQSISLEIAESQTSIQNISTCSRPAGYVTLDIEGSEVVIEDVKIIEQDGRLQLQLGDDSQASRQFLVAFDDDGVGAKVDTDLNIILKYETSQGPVEIFCSKSDLGCGFSKFELELSPEKSTGYYKGHFEGRFWGEKFVENVAGFINVKGDFLVER